MCEGVASGWRVLAGCGRGRGEELVVCCGRGRRLHGWDWTLEAVGVTWVWGWTAFTWGGCGAGHGWDASGVYFFGKRRNRKREGRWHFWVKRSSVRSDRQLFFFSFFFFPFLFASRSARDKKNVFPHY